MSADNIQVAVKVRPLLHKEKEQKLASCWKIVENSIQLIDSQTEPFCFDHIFDQDASNEKIFNTMAKEIVHSVVKGINGTILSYGQTSSGKTYTMMGDEVNPGVMVLAAQEIFKEIEKASDRRFLCRVGYIEIYNEKIYDLLNKRNPDLKIHDPSNGTVMVNCKECIFTCEDDLLKYLRMGNKERTVGETNMNERSSRSHAIFRIIIESQKLDRSEDDSVMLSVLNLVDLAGSERADQTGARGARLKEGGHINKSLLFLSNVIKSLSENVSEKFISYRDSKLTRILQDSLGGNALTSIICTVKPTAVEETQSTLSFAMRAKIVKNKPKVNEIVTDAALMKRLESEVNRLNALLAQERIKNENHGNVVQLERRIKNELLKMISSYSIRKVKEQKDIRRRTWCPATTKNEVTNNGLNSKNDSNAPITAIPIPTRPTKLQLPKPVNYLTPQIGILHRTPIEHEPNIDEEEFQPAELCSFLMSSPQISPNEKLKDCETPKLENKLVNVSITPTVTENVHTHLELVKKELVQLQEFTQLEKKLEIEYDGYEAIRQRLELVTERNSFLENERLEYIELIDEHKATEQKLNECQKGCKELQEQITYLSDLNRIANDKISNYEKLFDELNLKIKQLEMENREAVSLEFEFQSHKNKSQLRETELLDVISEKDEQIVKLEKSLHARTEEPFTNTKEDLLQASRFIKAVDSGDDHTENICVKCEDFQRLLEENKKVTHEFEKLTSEYEKLQLNFTSVSKDASDTQLKLAELELKHTYDMEECVKLRSEICVLRVKLEQVQADYIKLNCDNEAKTVAYDTLNQEVQRAHEEMLLLQEKYQRLESVWKTQESTLNNIQTEYDAIQLKYQNLQVQYENLEKTSVQTMEDCTRLQLENENLQTEINVLKVRVEKAQQELFDDVSSENVNFKKTIEQLQAELSDSQKRFDDMQKEYDDLSYQLMDNLQEAETLRKQNNKFEIELVELRRQNQSVESVQEKKPDLLAKIEKLTEENLQLQHLINEQRQNNEFLNTKNKKLFESTERTIEEMREQITKLSAELFEKSMFVENCACEDYKKQIEDLIKERADLTSICEHLQTQVSGFDHDISDAIFNTLNGKGVELQLKTDDMESTAKTMQNEQEIENDKSNETLMGTELMSNSLQLDNNSDCAKFNETLNYEVSMLLENSCQELKDNIKSNSTMNEKNSISFMSSLENEKEVYYTKVNQTLNGQETEQTVDPLQTVVKTEVTAFNETLTDEDEIEQLNDIIKDLEKTVENLSDQLASKQQEYALKIEENIALQNTCTIAQQHYDMLRLEHEQKMQKFQENEASEQNATAHRQQMDSLRAAYEQQIQEMQQKLADSKEQQDCKEKEYKNECNRLELEFYEKLDQNERESRENLRKYNRSWQDSKDNFEKVIASLEEKLAQCKCASIEEEKTKLTAKFEKKFLQMQEKLENIESLMYEKKQEADEAKNQLEIELSTKVAEIHDLQQNLNVLQEEYANLLKAQNEIADKAVHENAKNMDKLLELTQTNAKLLEECNLLDKVKEEKKVIDERRNLLEKEVSLNSAEITKLEKHVRVLEEERNKLLEAQTEIIKKSQFEQAENEAKLLQFVAEITQLQQYIKVLEEERNKLLGAQTGIIEKSQFENAENETKLLQLVETNTKLLEEQNFLEKDKDDRLREEKLLQTYAEAITSKFNDMLKIMQHDFKKPVVYNDEKFTSSEKLQEKLAQLDEIIEIQKLLTLNKKSQYNEENLKLVSKIRELENLNEQLNAAQAQACSELKAQLKTIDSILETQKELECNIKSSEAEKLQLQKTLEALRCELAELQQNLTHCSEEKQQLGFLRCKLEQEKQFLEQQLHDLHDRTDSEREKILEDSRKQIKNFDILNSENKKLKENIETLKKDHEQNLTSLKQENEKLQTTLKEYKSIQIEMQEKTETLEMKIKTLKQDLDKAKVQATVYSQHLVQHEELEKSLAQSQADNLALVGEIEQLKKKLQDTQKSQKDATEKILELKNKLHAELAQKVAATEKHVDLCQELAKLKEKLCLEQKASQRQTKELQSNIAELQFKCRLLEECKTRLQESNKSLEAQFHAVQQKAAKCESQSLLLEQLKSEKIELQAHIDFTKREQSERSEHTKVQLFEEYNNLMDIKEKEKIEATIKSLVLEKESLQEKLSAAESAQNEDQLKQLVEKHNNLMSTKESAFKDVEDKLESTIKVLLSEKKTLEEKLAATENARQQLVEEYKNLMDTKENSFKSEKQKLEATINCLHLEKKSVEEKLFAIENAFKKLENELTTLQKKCDSKNSSFEANSSISPRNRRSLDRTMCENHQLKSININLEDKLASLQQKTTKLEDAERKNRRLSAHDERRRQSLWCSSSDVSTMTDPTDSNCNCVELDLKLKECQRNLFIRQSQVSALNMEIKNHPLKSENISLKKRLIDEQEKSRSEILALKKKLEEEQMKCHIEIKKYKQIIVEQKTKTASSTLTASSGGSKSSSTSDGLKKHVECQTDTDLESAEVRKLKSKYSDMKNICRSRYNQIKTLEEQVALMSREKENTGGNVPMSSLEIGNLNALKQQNETLKKYLRMCEQKFDDANTRLHRREQEIDSLRAQLNMQSESK